MKFIKDNSLIILFGLLCLLTSISCKKEPIPPKDPIVEQPPPKGVMEGSYKWYAGDSATADLVLTTHVLNCAYCASPYYDYYNYNLFIPRYNLQSAYIKYPHNTKLDTLIYYTENLKIFKYARY